MFIEESQKGQAKAAQVAATFRFEPPEPTVSGNSTPRHLMTPSTPTTPRHNYNDPSVVYVNRDFFATCEEQLSVFVDDELEILEETPGGAWTRVREKESKQDGLIPSDILETGHERLAQENKLHNQDLLRRLSCSGEPVRKQNKTDKRKVSFSKGSPDVCLFNPTDFTQDTFRFPYLMEEESQDALTTLEATMFDAVANLDSIPDEQRLGGTHDLRSESLFARMIKGFRLGSSSGASGSSEKDSESKQILQSLQSFPQYEDHLIRIYTGNFDSLLHGYKTFIVDENVPLAQFTQLVVDSFGLGEDGFEYELNLINHLTAEVIPMNLELTIAEIIELTKREALVFSSAMPKELKKAQKLALKRMKRKSADQVIERDKQSDYVTPFKFVLNRIYREGRNVPVWVNVHLAGTPQRLGESGGATSSNLVMNSLSESISEGGHPYHHQIKNKDKKKRKGFLARLFKKDKNKLSSEEASQLDVIERIRIGTDESVFNLISSVLERFGVPSVLPRIVFEASLPAVHDASKFKFKSAHCNLFSLVELPLSMNMTVGDALRIRAKLDPSQQIIQVRPSIRYANM